MCLLCQQMLLERNAWSLTGTQRPMLLALLQELSEFSVLAETNCSRQGVSTGRIGSAPGQEPEGFAGRSGEDRYVSQNNAEPQG